MLSDIRSEVVHKGIGWAGIAEARGNREDQGGFPERQSPCLEESCIHWPNLE
jgi:hypothetical protein